MASVEQFNQFLQRTIRLGTTERYDIRKFNDGGNFLLVDTHGDYLVIERESADDICNLIFTDISTKTKDETEQKWQKKSGNENERVGVNAALNVPYVHIIDGWEIQKEERDILIIDNKWHEDEKNKEKKKQTETKILAPVTPFKNKEIL